jgi:hypothetical protein
LLDLFNFSFNFCLCGFPTAVSSNIPYPPSMFWYGSMPSGPSLKISALFCSLDVMTSTLPASHFEWWCFLHFQFNPILLWFFDSVCYELPRHYLLTFAVFVPNPKMILFSSSQFHFYLSALQLITQLCFLYSNCCAS